MQAWWNSLILIEQIFAATAISSSIILVLQIVLMIIGLGGNDADLDLESDVSGIGDSFDLDVDSDVDIDDFDVDSTDSYGLSVDGGLRLVTFRGIIAFFSIFGWCGLACTKAGWTTPLSLVVATLAGLLAMVIIALIMRLTMKLQVNGTIDIKNAIGKSATVYIRIPNKRSSSGKISVLVQDQLIEIDAVTDEPFDLTTGQEVVVIGLSSQNTVIVASKKL